MTDQTFAPAAGDATTQSSTTASAGALLRAAREKQGLHIAALAAAIKVAPRKLDALEHDRWDELPDATFTRALAQTVCRTLKIDAKPVLERLPAATPTALGRSGGGLNMPFNERSGRDEPGIGSAAVKPMVWVSALLMVAAVAVYLLPENLWMRTPAADAPVTLAPGVAAPVAGAVVPASAAPATPAAPDAVLPGASAAMPAPAAATAASQPTVDTVFAAPQSGDAASAAGAAALPAALVQLRASEASWVEVRDGRNQILLSRTVLPGESVGLNGSLPLRLTIGNAAATQLGFRGQAVDLTSRTRDNIARVELQ